MMPLKVCFSGFVGYGEARHNKRGGPPVGLGVAAITVPYGSWCVCVCAACAGVLGLAGEGGVLHAVHRYLMLLDRCCSRALCLP
jgi:hypothetical protein